MFVLETYAAEVWGLEDAQIEKIRTFEIKRFLNVPLHSSNKMIYGETGRFLLFIRTSVKCIEYWLKLTRLPMTTICRQASKMLLLQHEAGRQNWATRIQNILAKMVLILFGGAKVWVLRHVSLLNLKIGLFPATNKTGIRR